jgi:hypothetical protein
MDVGGVSIHCWAVTSAVSPISNSNTWNKGEIQEFSKGGSTIMFSFQRGFQTSCIFFFYKKMVICLKTPAFPQLFSSKLIDVHICIKMILLYSNIIQFIRFNLKYSYYLKFPIFGDFSSINDVLASKSQLSPQYIFLNFWYVFKDIYQTIKICIETFCCN